MAGAAIAQEKEYSVSFLRAAAGSLGDRAPVVVVGAYLANPGLLEAQGFYLRGKGFSRFSAKDTQTGAVFTSMYCDQNSKAFSDLVGSKTKNYRFYGYKDRGEENESGFFVTRVEAIREAEKPAAAPTTAKSFRVTITDNATSNRTVVANVSPGQSYAVGGVTFKVEIEPSASGAAVHGEPGPETETRIPDRSGGWTSSY